MRLDILKNEKKSNHLNCLEKMSTQADTLIIVSPFVADDISKLLNNISMINILPCRNIMIRPERQFRCINSMNIVERNLLIC